MSEENNTAKKSMTDRLSVFPKWEEYEAAGWTDKPKAQQIRYLRSLQEEEDRGSIAKYLNIKYQWVRNVLITPTK